MPVPSAVRYVFSSLQLLLADVLRYRLFIFPSPAHGHLDVADLRRAGHPILTVFDVGANVGQSAIRFRAAFPHATIHCFEPVSTTFEALVRNVPSRRVVCHRLALAERPGRSRIFLGELSATNSMVEEKDSGRFEEVDVDTIDGVRERLRIDTVDLLKIDAEGYDLHVLRGATESLQANKIAFVLVEAGFSRQSKKHVPFGEIEAFMKGLDLELIGIYEQTPEWSGELRLRFANVLFAQKAIARVKRRFY